MQRIIIKQSADMPDITSLDFDIINAPETIRNDQVRQLEILSAKGVDGQLYRDTGKRPIPFVLRCFRFHPDFTDARRFGQFAANTQGYFASMDLGVNGNFDDVLIIGVTSIARPSLTFGPNVDSSYTAISITNITMVLT